MAERVFGSFPDSLESLTITFSGLCVEHCEALGSAIKVLPSLTKLNLRSNEIGNEGAIVRPCRPILLGHGFNSSVTTSASMGGRNSLSSTLSIDIVETDDINYDTDNEW